MGTRRILGGSWQRVLVVCMMGVLFLVGGSALGTTAHAQASPTATGKTVTTLRILSFSQVAQPAPVRDVVSNDCLGTSLLGSSGSPGLWSSGGNASNGCPVAMRSATVRLTITMNCPLGNLSANQSYLLAPPDWPNTIVKQWTVAGQALCFSCVDGEVVGPPYTLTVSATVQGEGTDYRLYNSGGPVSVNFPMRQFPPHTPC